MVVDVEFEEEAVPGLASDVSGIGRALYAILSAIGTNSIKRRSRHETLRKRAEGSEELKLGKGASKDILKIYRVVVALSRGT